MIKFGHFSLLFIFVLFLSQCRQSTESSASPDFSILSPIDRYGTLFEDVQKARIFPDGKTFADCIPKFSTETIIRNYNTFKASESADDLEAFVMDHFELPPQFASGFKSDTSRSAQEHINILWDVLKRTPDQKDPGSLIALPNPYIVPGGRFREIYYWDSYFTMLGLYESNRIDIIENMVNNFAYLIDSIGFIPNGNRTYFLTRSQPPFFASMVKLLAQKQGSDALVNYLPQLQKEYDFWMRGKEQLGTQNGVINKVIRMPDGSILNRYFDKGLTPRAEMFADDLETAEKSRLPENVVYQHIRSACESGWDFSCRWFTDPNDLSTIHTNDIIPVDLNALLYKLEMTLAEANQAAGNTAAVEQYEALAAARQKAIITYCWDSENSYFRDYDFMLKKFTPVYSIAGMYPLFFSVVPDTINAAPIAQTVRDKFLRPGGVVSTNLNTGQQWDAPNGWAPLQWITIKGLRNYEQTSLADSIKQRWVALNLKVYKQTGKMVEKYNVEDIALEAGGGEYPVQDGFGWTNGVLLKLLSE